MLYHRGEFSKEPIMKVSFLDFESQIAELEDKIEQLRFVQDDSALDIADEISRLSKKSVALTKEVYSKLTPWQISQVSRHPQRPYTLDYIEHLFTDFEELHGDRVYADDKAIVGGLARFNGQSVMVIGHQKGRDTKEKIVRNFGMPRPEGYRKAMRLMRLAEKFGIPIMTFIDTPGAYPGVGAEERGQSEAIGRNLYEMTELRVPIICTVIGEGGSGGALALGVTDRILMLEYAIYSVISPEGCASILWRDPSKIGEAAAQLKLTAPDLVRLGICDEIIPEAAGGAHRNAAMTAAKLRASIKRHLRELSELSTTELLEQRYQKFRKMGAFVETPG
jgi:acetyl-CoA carboxylase carboxyl transferase subunit alpha